MFLHDQCPLLVNHLAISACWGPTETWFALHQWVAMFEMVVPLLYLYDAHSIVTESLLNLLIRKICCITPVQVILSLCTSENLMGMHLLAGWLPATDTLCRQKKTQCMHMKVPYTTPEITTCVCFIYFHGRKNKVRLFEEHRGEKMRVYTTLCWEKQTFNFEVS